MSKAVRMGMLVVALAGGVLSPAAAGTARRADVQRLKTELPVGDTELAGMRAGFFTASGAQFDFGATVTTTINGQLALQTNLTWTPAGALVQQMSSLGPSIQAQVQGQVAGLGTSIQSQVASDLAKAGIADPVAPNAAAAVQTVPVTSQAVAPAPAASVQSVPTVAQAATSLSPATASPAPTVLASASAPASTPSNITPAAAPTVSAPAASVAAQVPASVPAATSLAAAGTPAPASAPTTVATVTNILPSASTSGSGGAPTILTGIQLQSATGTTQVISNIGANQLQNILINSASNQDIVQNTNLFFTIYNFADWQKQLSQNAISSQLANEIMVAAGIGGSR